MAISTKTLDNKAQIIISGLFDASVYREFKHACAMLTKNQAVTVIEVDLSGTEYLDSAALGMLVQLNENAKYEKKTVTLISVPGRVADVLKIANAQKLFSIHLPSGMDMDLR
jgi:HptB-dependent secretion and biofilm anti anti-sigma factor